jgi:hypothetical protein
MVLPILRLSSAWSTSPLWQLPMEPTFDEVHRCRSNALCMASSFLWRQILQIFDAVYGACSHQRSKRITANRSPAAQGIVPWTRSFPLKSSTCLCTQCCQPSTWLHLRPIDLAGPVVDRPLCSHEPPCDAGPWRCVEHSMVGRRHDQDWSASLNIPAWSSHRF